jgi:DNA-binding NarL/FixJ family response regulator
MGWGALIVSSSETQMTERPRPARIVIADDNLTFRRVLSHILSRETGLQVVGEAADGIEVLELCRRLEPDLVVMDLRMPEMDGSESTRIIKKEFPRTLVLVLTSLAEAGYLSQALEVGAEGCVLKYASLKEIVGAIRSVLRGELVASGGITNGVASE